MLNLMSVCSVSLRVVKSAAAAHYASSSIKSMRTAYMGLERSCTATDYSRGACMSTVWDTKQASHELCETVSWVVQTEW